ncbi:MAG TPA: hypothetical protein VNN81_05630, partial [Bradyrhizobium sp.]|nr:hypothetical protein [Bradyrhizobium sp.]
KIGMIPKAREVRLKLQRDSRAIRLDQEKGLPAAIQKSPYHSTLIPGTSFCREMRGFGLGWFSYADELGLS